MTSFPTFFVVQVTKYTKKIQYKLHNANKNQSRVNGGRCHRHVLFNRQLPIKRNSANILRESAVARATGNRLHRRARPPRQVEPS